MDYTHAPLAFKLRKALRYGRLYGPRRTIVKVRSQYHMQRRYRELPVRRSRMGPERHVAILGCGTFAYSTIAYYLTRRCGPILRAAMDVEVNRAASLFERYQLDYYTDDPEEVITDQAIDLIYIASNHASHAEYAIRALREGKHVHIEKPHAVSTEQLRHLCDAMSEFPGRVTLGFNRTRSRIGREIKRYLGTQEGPAVYSWFIAGHAIPPDHWYFRPEEGGRVLGNLCHWTDFVYWLVPPDHRYPIAVRPTRADRSDSDLAVTYEFGDGTVAAITFSAKGHTFEGVKERFAAHRGDVLITMDDFGSMTVDVGPRKHRIRSRFRDHGHEASVLNSLRTVRPELGPAEVCSQAYAWGTGELFLTTRRALEESRQLILTPSGSP